MNRAEWSRQFASRLGNATPTPEMIRWISAWTLCENTRAAYNPLATSYKMDGDSSFNGIVRNYPDAETGLNASVSTILRNKRGYADIRQGILSNNINLAMRGIYAAEWGTSGTCVDIKYNSKQEYEADDLPSFQAQRESDTWTPGTSSGGSWEEKSEETLLDQAGDVLGIPTGADVERYKRRTVYIVTGGVLMLIATVIAIKTFIPTEQIVKTVTQVAAAA